MAKLFEELDATLTDWIAAQHVFFVASAPSTDGHVNLSPKGHDALRVVDPRTVAYLDLTGSGAETIAHARENGRLTIMWCAFEGPPLILRVYGTATAHPVGTDRYAALAPLFPPIVGARSVIVLDVEQVQTSCGYAVPLMDYRAERPTLQQWARRKGDDGLAEYWSDTNAESLDGLPALRR